MISTEYVFTIRLIAQQVRKPVMKVINVIFLAFETLPYPSYAPTSAEIEKLKLRGTNHRTIIH